MHALKSTDHKRQSGFALVMALSLMAFVLMLILSMSLLVQVETTNASRSLDQLRAKEAARLALMMAIGDLQKHAGPDDKVTARAEILGSARTTENAYWTGVWDSENPTTNPHWLVSWQNQLSTEPTRTLEVVSGGSVHIDPTQHVEAPIITVIGDGNSTTDEIAWYISDEGTKASLGTLPLNARADPSFLDANAIDALELQISTTHGLEELITGYDRFTSSEAEKLDRISSVAQALNLLGSTETADIDGESAYHVFAPASFGVLANTLPATESGSGLMQDLSLYPQLLGTGVEEFLNFGEVHATLQESAGNGVKGLRLFTDIQGLEALPTLNDGDVVTPITPILSNMMIAFSIRSNSASDPRLYLRMRCLFELWNPYTHSLSMVDSEGNSMNIELDFIGLPTVNVLKKGVPGGSSTLDMQSLLADPYSNDSALTIRLINDISEDWLPGRSKNWVGVNAGETATTSPYDSIVTTDKKWRINNRTLGGSRGIDTGVDLSGKGDLSVVGNISTDLVVKVYLVDDSLDERYLLTELNSMTYEPVETLPRTYTNKGVNFGYHFVIRGPHFSSFDPDYYRGVWLRNHDHRNPRPTFFTHWNIDFDRGKKTGSAYLPVKDGISTLANIHPEEISESGTINTVAFRRILDRSPASGSYNKLWQDAPLFELPRKRVLSLASLQHLYFHNERPFQVGNSWGSEDTTNTSEWFDRYYFSGISRSDTADDFKADAGAPNPVLVNYDLEDGSNKILNWQSENSADATKARQPAAHFMVTNRFNINSTSVAAWKSILGSLRLDSWSYLDYPENDTSDLSSLSVSTESREGTFARFSNSLEETYEAPASPPTVYYNNKIENVAPSAYYRHGARRFDSTDIECLAKEIVRQLQLKRTPFVSMKDFLSVEEGKQTSLLENVIKIVLAPTSASRLESPNTSPYITTNTGRQQWFHKWETLGERDPNEVAIEIDHFSPGFLTQADIVTAIGPMLAPRSDTFKIRTRAQSYSSTGEIAASAALEATVQRTPEPVDPAADILSSTDRKFSLLSIRWLSDDEI
jgi:Tfp pilus assembly protein PilX